MFSYNLLGFSYYMIKKGIEILKHFEILDDDLLHKSNYFRQHLVLEEKNLLINDYEESRS